MVNFTKSNTLFMILSLLLCSILSCFIGATYFNSSITLVHIGIYSSLITTFGFLFAVIKYNEWISEKKKDDQYSSAKSYLSKLSQIKQIIEELDRSYFRVCPSAGLIVEGKEQSIKIIQYINQLSERLYSLTREGQELRDELYFWNVNFTSEYNKKHQEIMNDLRDMSMIIQALNSQLNYFYLEKNEGFLEILIEKKNYDNYVSRLYKNLDVKALVSFENVFIMSSNI